MRNHSFLAGPVAAAEKVAAEKVAVEKVAAEKAAAEKVAAEKVTVEKVAVAERAARTVLTDFLIQMALQATEAAMDSPVEVPQAEDRRDAPAQMHPPERAQSVYRTVAEAATLHPEHPELL